MAPFERPMKRQEEEATMQRASPPRSSALVRVPSALSKRVSVPSPFAEYNPLASPASSTSASARTASFFFASQSFCFS